MRSQGRSGFVVLVWLCACAGGWCRSRSMPPLPSQVCERPATTSAGREAPAARNRPHFMHTASQIRSFNFRTAMFMNLCFARFKFRRMCHCCVQNANKKSRGQRTANTLKTIAHRRLELSYSIEAAALERDTGKSEALLHPISFRLTLDEPQWGSISTDHRTPGSRPAHALIVERHD